MGANTGAMTPPTKARMLEPAPFLLELPPYRMPTLHNIWLHVWERGRDFLGEGEAVEEAHGADHGLLGDQARQQSHRRLENDKDRRMTILLVPFMSCGARLPIYGLMTAAFFPKYAGLVVFGLYILGPVKAPQGPVHDEGRPGHVAAVLQHGEEQKQQRDHGQEGQHAAHAGNQPVYQHHAHGLRLHGSRRDGRADHGE